MPESSVPFWLKLCEALMSSELALRCSDGMSEFGIRKQNGHGEAFKC